MEYLASTQVDFILYKAEELALDYRHEFVTPEHLLRVLLYHEHLIDTFEQCGVKIDKMTEALDDILYEQLERVPKRVEYDIMPSAQYTTMLELAKDHSPQENGEISVIDIICSIYKLKESWASHLLHKYVHDFAAFVATFVMYTDFINDFESGAFYDDQDPEEAPSADEWRNMVTCLNDLVDSHNPLIGREAELQRTIQVLCRKDKNNPLHIGESGVGKTALAYGLAALINKGKVPKRLKKCKIYALEVASLIAGAQFRGDLEKRIKIIMEGATKEQNAIIYIDDLHNIVGSGRTSESSMDTSTMLKPYLENGAIKFMGATTYDDYNRYFAKSKGIIRRFQTIDIKEPSIDEAIGIVNGLKKKYEEFHGVTYADDVMEHTVKMAARHITDRYLPDKAIDLIDEAGAYCELNKPKGGVVTTQVIDQLLQRICKIEAESLNEESNEALSTLYSRIAAQVYGQDHAITQVVEAIQLAKAGLIDEGKPLASLLFVGPTGVGKTEVAKVLAQQLGITLQRFDMSEYAEKHAVAKLIGSPAGYVGYDDGGLLTDAIRKTPNCVLLLDEIEKAHRDIYDILLQVMDYAQLTDNKGTKVDFRNVVLIMTSNAGAQYAHQATLGFNSKITTGDAMLKQVKKTFKPEFLNRLSGTVVFNEMDRTMAALILDKKLRELYSKLQARGVEATLTAEAHEWLLHKSFTKEYGAREMDRILGKYLKPLFMREVLFGALSQGGKATVSIAEQGEELKIVVA